jgi:hypothetical protein
MLFDHITLPNLRDLSVGKIDSKSLQSQFISFLRRSSSPLQRFSFEFPPAVDGMWEDNMIQIMQHIPSLHSLCLRYDWYGVDGGSFLERLDPRILDNGRVDCLIPRLNTISIMIGCQLVTPDYGALIDMIVSRYSLSRGTSAGDNVSGPIDRIQKVEVKCPIEMSWDGKDDTTWYEEVSEMLAPLQEFVDMVRVVRY